MSGDSVIRYTTLGSSDLGGPGTRPYYEPTFYVAYVRDPDRNKLACAFHRHGPTR